MSSLTDYVPNSSIFGLFSESRLQRDSFLFFDVRYRLTSGFIRNSGVAQRRHSQRRRRHSGR